MSEPKWLNRPDTTRARSRRQESRLAKELLGYPTINSGATLSQNDVVTDYCELEAKTTRREQFIFKLEDWDKLTTKCQVGKVPIFVIEFEGRKLELAVLNIEDLNFLVAAAQTPKTEE